MDVISRCYRCIALLVYYSLGCRLVLLCLQQVLQLHSMCKLSCSRFKANFNTSSSYSLSVILVCTDGAIASRISSDLYDVCHKWLGRLVVDQEYPTVTLVGYLVLFAVLLLLFRNNEIVALPEMKKYGQRQSVLWNYCSRWYLGHYDSASVAFILYGTVSEQSRCYRIELYGIVLILFWQQFMLQINPNWPKVVTLEKSYAR